MVNAPDVLRRQHRALNTTYRRRPPPPGFGGDWWTIWWRRQQRRHQAHIALAITVGVLAGRTWPR